jgi:hypothetical protein
MLMALLEWSTGEAVRERARGSDVWSRCRPGPVRRAAHRYQRKHSVDFDQLITERWPELENAERRELAAHLDELYRPPTSCLHVYRPAIDSIAETRFFTDNKP